MDTEIILREHTIESKLFRTTTVEGEGFSPEEMHDVYERKEYCTETGSCRLVDSWKVLNDGTKVETCTDYNCDIHLVFTDSLTSVRCAKHEAEHQAWVAQRARRRKARESHDERAKEFAHVLRSSKCAHLGLDARKTRGKPKINVDLQYGSWMDLHDSLNEIGLTYNLCVDGYSHVDTQDSRNRISIALRDYSPFREMFFDNLND